jgi:type I restriction enzyme S subunit
MSQIFKFLKRAIPTRERLLRNVSQEKIESVLLPLPPWEEQETIAAAVDERISLITATEDQTHTNLLRAARLRQSILKQAFEGKLVSQDPNDEPATVLLERLRTAGRGKMELVNGSPRTRPRRPSSSQKKQEDLT